MTDPEIAEAVARECFGWRDEWEDAAGDAVKRDAEGMEQPFEPCVDARDAERVWDWLVEHSQRAHVSRTEAGAGVWCGLAERYSADWKRGLCEAALEVARARDPA